MDARPEPRRLSQPRDLVRLHARVLAPSFPPAELMGAGALVDAVDTGRVEVLAFVDDDGEPVAGVVGAWSERTRVLLVMYLAIAPGRRSGGLGGRLLGAALDTWATELDPVVVLAEVEHPAFHEASVEHGDPAARVRFYARHGGRALAVPYFQPGDGPGAPRVPALLLVALRAAGIASIPAAPVRTFVEDYLRTSEGTLASDAATRRLLDALAGEQVALVPLEDVGPDGSGAPAAQLPVGVLAPDESSAPSGPAAPSGSR